MRHWRATILGALFGAALAAWWLVPQVRADRAGEEVLGFTEAAFLTSLPGSLLTWGVLLLAPEPIPRLIGYTWMALTPVLNWAAVGTLIGWWRTRRGRPPAV